MSESDRHLLDDSLEAVGTAAKIDPTGYGVFVAAAVGLAIGAVWILLEVFAIIVRSVVGVGRRFTRSRSEPT